jgi:glucose-6-phosphate isomerase
MGGSILGAKTIYNFLSHKIKKKFLFIDNIKTGNFKISSKKKLNLVISKSGNTLETITNANILIKKKDKNLFITENKKSYLTNLATKLKADVVHHNDFIGGRYSVLSEVGMLPAELMGLRINKFKKFNNLIKNKSFLNSLVLNVANTLNLIKKKKFNSIILNYDEKASDLFFWYQQLIAESLGKKNKGILPVVSLMPRDNHSLMQLYLDGFKNNFFTFFFVKDSSKNKINNLNLLESHFFLKGKNLNNILEAQYLATKKIFRKNKIPFRSFYINKRDEEALGELFTFFILETILLGMALKVNPYNQPAVELIKKETSKILR